MSRAIKLGISITLTVPIIDCNEIILSELFNFHLMSLEKGTKHSEFVQISVIFVT